MRKFSGLWFILIALLTAVAQGQVPDSLWVDRINGPASNADNAVSVVVDDSGHAYATGYIRNVGSPANNDYITVKYEPDGDTVWRRLYGATAGYDDRATDVRTDSARNVYVTGTSAANLVPPGSADYDLATLKYSPSGTLLWTRRYDASGNTDEYASDMEVDSKGNAYVLGRGGTTAYTTNFDFITIKYKPNGDTAWVRRYNGTGNTHDTPYDLVLDQTGNVYVTGPSGGSGTNDDVVIVKYDSLGVQQWVARYNHSGTFYDNSYAMDLAGSNLYVTGSTWSGSSYDYLTLKYTTGGALVWARLYNGPDNGSDVASGLVVDGGGNIIVTGTVSNAFSNTRIATAKYNSSGDTLWTRVHSEPGDTIIEGAYSFPAAVLVDADDDIYMGGTSGFDFLVIKYSTSGDSLWAARYDGPLNGADQINDLALDTNKNVYVAGISSGIGTVYDFTAIKYDQAPFSMMIQALSPVNLIVTDPAGDSIGVNFNTIGYALYNVPNDSVFILELLDGNYLIQVIRDPLDPSPDSNYSVNVRIDGKDVAALATNAPVPAPGDTHTYVITSDTPIPECLSEPGDANADGNQNLSDVITIVNFVFARAGCLPLPDCWFKGLNCRGNWNGDGSVGLSDVIRAVNKVFSKPGGPWDAVATEECCLPLN